MIIYILETLVCLAFGFYIKVHYVLFIDSWRFSLPKICHRVDSGHYFSLYFHSADVHHTHWSNLNFELIFCIVKKIARTECLTERKNEVFLFVHWEIHGVRKYLLNDFKFWLDLNFYLLLTLFTSLEWDLPLCLVGDCYVFVFSNHVSNNTRGLALRKCIFCQFVDSISKGLRYNNELSPCLAPCSDVNRISARVFCIDRNKW